MNAIRIEEAAEFRPEKMNKVNLFESRRMFCDIYCLEPGQAQKVHSHRDNDKIYCVFRGKGRFTIGDQRRILEEGEAVCAFAGQPHGVENTGEERLLCLVFMAPHPRPPDTGD